MPGTYFCMFSYWWIFPIIMMLFCFFMIKERDGPGMCGCGSCCSRRSMGKGKDSTIEVSDRRNVPERINTAECEEDKRIFIDPIGRSTE